MLAKLNLPTFILFAKDDPVVPFKSLPINILSKNKNVHIMLT
jgi:predicted alpha/beta-fold hydrolase